MNNHPIAINDCTPPHSPDSIAISAIGKEVRVANLLVRDLDPKVVNALKRRAAKHGRSAEAEHREILRQALLGPSKKSFAEMLAAMPNAGQDEDFERIEDDDDHVSD